MRRTTWLPLSRNIDGREFLASLIEREELKIGGSVVKPGHPLGRGLLISLWDDDFEPAKVTAGIAFLAAVVEPENAQGKDAVDGGGGFCFAHADDGFGGSAAKKAATNVGGAEAVFEIHRGTQAVDLGARKSAGEDTFKESLDSCGARSRGLWECGGRYWGQVREPAALQRPCDG